MQARVLTYEVGRADLVAFHTERLEARPETRTLIRTGQIAVAATGLLVMAGAAAIAHPPALFHVSLGAFVLLGVGLYPRTFRRSARGRIQTLVAREDHGDALGAQVLTMDDRGLTRQSAAGSAVTIPWARVDAVDVTARRVAVRFDDASTLLIPRSAFADSADMEAFAAAARARGADAAG